MSCGGELLDEDSDEVVDVVLLWWRDDDGDLVDRLMDAITPLADDGVIWVVTPKTGKPGHVQPAEIAESAPTAGLMQTSSANLGDWIASRLVQPKSKAARQALVLDCRRRARRTSRSRTSTASAVTLIGFCGARNVLLVFFPLAFTGMCQGELERDPRPAARVPERRHRDAGHLGRPAAHPQGLGDRRAGSCSPCCPISGRTARWRRPTACSTPTPASRTGAPSRSIGSGSSGSPR